VCPTEGNVHNWAALARAQPAGHRKGLFPLRACVCAHVECPGQCWSSHYKRGTDKLEQRQRRATETGRGCST